MMAYNRLVYNVKKVLPIAKECRGIILETYDYLQTLPNKEARDRHLKLVEKGIKAEYTPRMKRLTYQQGKLLIKLIYRECNSSSHPRRRLSGLCLGLRCQSAQGLRARGSRPFHRAHRSPGRERANLTPPRIVSENLMLSIMPWAPS